MIWTKSDIRLARKADLVSILTDRNYRLYPIGNGNFRILPALSAIEGPDPDDPHAPACPEQRRGAGVIVKHNFWIWPEKNISGNAIDFFTRVEKITFNETMQIITAKNSYDPSERKIRKEPGNIAKFARQ